MARGKVYNIANRLGGARPVIVIDDEHEYKVRTSLPIVVKLQAMAKDKDFDQVAGIADMIALALGKEAYAYIESKDLPFNELTVIVNAIMAAISGDDLEDTEEVVNQAKTGKQKD